MTAHSGRREISDWIGFGVFCAWSLMYVGLIVDAVSTIPTVVLFLAPSVAAELVIASAFLARRPVRERSAGWVPRAVAHAGTFLLPMFFWAAGRWKPEWLHSSAPMFVGVGALLWLVGTLVTLWTVWTLRRAFSIEPQARELITRGPYRLVRHPIYLSYLLQFGGLWMAHMTLPVTLAVCTWVALMLARVGFEEQVLAKAFPEYRQYADRAGRLAPRLVPARLSQGSFSQGS